MFWRFGLAVAFSLSAICFQQPTFAAAWPNKPIHIIVPLPAGSAADTVARLVGRSISGALHQTVVVDDRPGASGEIGTTALKTSEPDGYTIGIATTTTMVTAPILAKYIRYDPVKDFATVAMVGYSPYVLIVNPKVPAKTVKEFIALAKSKPGRLTYSSVGVVSLAHLAVGLLQHDAGIKLNEIPYKSSTQAVLDLLAGRIDSQFGILTTSHEYIKEGKLIALGVTTAKRIPRLPDVPTLAESGLPGFEATLWLGVIAPAKTPPEIVAKLNAAINHSLTEKATRNFLSTHALYADPMTPAAMHKKIANDIKKWKQIAIEARLIK